MFLLKIFYHTHPTQMFGLFFIGLSLGHSKRVSVMCGRRRERERKVRYRRQRGSSVPDSWLNFRWTLSNCRVRTNSCGTMAAELSLSKLSFRLLRNRGKRTKEWLRKSDKVHSAWRGGSVRKIISQLLTQNCYLILWKRRDFYRKVASTLMINRHVVLVS